MMPIGMNLTNVSYYGAEAPFIDRMRSAAGNVATWDKQLINAGGAGCDTLTRQGYPASVPADASNVHIMVPLVMPGRYVVKWGGKVTIRLTGIGAASQSGSTGRIEFDYAGPYLPASFMQITIYTMDAADPIRDLHVVRLEDEAAHAAGEIFNPAFLARFGDFNAFRFMDWGRTNNSQPVTWATRATPDQLSWVLGPDGVPLETRVALCNKTGAGMWLNIPTLADDDYVRRALTLVRDTLRPELHLDVEYSNEVWNWGFAASKISALSGDQQFGIDANHDGKIDSADPKEHVGDGWLQFYGYRAAQVAKIAKDVFATQLQRLTCVIAPQTYNPPAAKSIFAGAMKANVGAPRDLFGAYAVTTYFAGQLNGAGVQASRDIVLGWANGGAAGLDTAFKEMEFGGLLPFHNALSDLPAIYAQHKALADQHGLQLVAYEGGFGADAAGFTAPQQAVIVDFLTRIVNDPRMSGLYAKMIEQFAAAGGTRLMALGSVSPITKGGAWGAIESINREHSPRLDVLVAAAIKAKPPVVVPPVVVPPKPKRPTVASLTTRVNELEARIGRMEAAH